MIELIQFPWSPFCIVQRRILEFSGARFKVTNIPSCDRSLVWRLTKQRYYNVPVLREGKTVVFEVSEESQVIAKYIDAKLGLGLFPWEHEGVQSLIWRYIENDIEGVTFKLNDVFWLEFVPENEQLAFLRHKERKFGRDCLTRWRNERKGMLEELERRLMPFEEMLLHRPYLLGSRPFFIDFDLFGMLGNLLYSGHYRLPKAHDRLAGWYGRMNHIQWKSLAREKELHS